MLVSIVNDLLLFYFSHVVPNLICIMALGFVFLQFLNTHLSTTWIKLASKA